MFQFSRIQKTSFSNVEIGDDVTVGAMFEEAFRPRGNYQTYGMSENTDLHGGLIVNTPPTFQDGNDHQRDE